MAELDTQAALLDALEEERAALDLLLARFDEPRWRGVFRADGWSAHDIAAHLADSNYGLALLVLGEIKPSLPLSDSGWMQADDYNQQRREKNAALPKEKVAARLASSFEHARRAIVATEDLAAPGPYGPVHTKQLWLNRIIDHTRSHRAELEELAG
jgi:Mycothiol maleylpyruvate isomerase N-terminal domain